MKGLIVQEEQFYSGCGKSSAILLFLVLISGCTFNHNMTIDLKLDNLPVTTKEPVTVGMYYGPEISTATCARQFGSHRYIISIGKDSVDLFDRVAAMVFRDVVRLDGLPPFTTGSPAVDMIIEPEIEAFNFRLGIDRDSPEHSIRYRLHFYTKEGVPAGTRSVTGKQVPVKNDHWSNAGYVEDNMIDAAVKVLQEFHRLPNIAAALKSPSTERVANSGLLVTAEPVPGPLLFSDELSIPLEENGIIAITVTAHNTSDRSLSLSEEDMRLVLPGGRTIGRSGSATIPAYLEQRSYAGDVAAGMLGAPFGILVTFGTESEKKAKRTKTLNTLAGKAFGNRILGPREHAEGLVFFIPAKGTPPFTAADLSLWVFDAERGAARQVRLALAALQFGSATNKK